MSPNRSKHVHYLKNKSLTLFALLPHEYWRSRKYKCYRFWSYPIGDRTVFMAGTLTIINLQCNLHMRWIQNGLCWSCCAVWHLDYGYTWIFLGSFRFRISVKVRCVMMQQGLTVLYNILFSYTWFSVKVRCAKMRQGLTTV